MENVSEMSSLAAQRNVCESVSRPASPPFVPYTILPAIT